MTVPCRRKAFGRRGEDLAAEFLQKKGFSILHRNFQTRYGEIDIIAQDQETLVFIEVRTRQHEEFGNPLETVNHRKQNRIIRLAKMYLAVNEVASSVPCRFDVVGMVMTETGKEEPEITHIENAFSA